MNDIPDRLTTKFAYDYVMQHDSIPSGIQEIITNRIHNWGDYYDITNLYGYSKYEGDPILLSENEIEALALRLKEIQDNRDCEWCAQIINSINNK
jgi:hypothetical protein